MARAKTENATASFFRAMFFFFTIGSFSLSAGGNTITKKINDKRGGIQ